MATSRRRIPLGELPLFDFMPPPNSKCACPSPLSTPHKRALQSPRHGNTSTPKRPRPVSTLHNDDLGTGKSPARRLFTDEPATPTPKKATVGKLAPSPPLPSNTPVASSSTPRRQQGNIHAVGFVIFQDDEQQSPRAVPVDADTARDEENIPPSAPSASEKHDASFKRSKICIRAG